MVLRHPLIGLAVVCLCGGAGWAQQYTITTFAGNGVQGFAGDTGPPASAELSSPGSIAIDSSGNIYIADSGNHRVRKVSGGIINTIAGTGTAGNAGDKSAASSAQLNIPAGLAFDSSGNLYIADSAAHVVRQVSSSGTITTFAGTGNSSVSGDNGPAVNAELMAPNSVAVDTSGNVYIADSGQSTTEFNGVIREVLKSGTIITAVGGGATAGKVTHPTWVAVDSTGALYIADPGLQRVVKWAAGTLTIVAGNGGTGFSGDGGPATQAQLNNPAGVAVDSTGNVYIADANNSRIRKVSGGIITTIAGNGKFGYTGDGGPATSAALNFPHSITVDSAGNVYVCDSNNAVVRLLQPVFPVISDGGVTNAASYQPQVSAGALASVFGSNFALAYASAKTLPLDTSLGGVSVSVNGHAAPILFVSPSQVNFQVPWETTGNSAAVTVNVAGAPSNAVSVPLKTAAPGLFFQASGAAIVANSDFTLNGPGNPAPAGSTVVAYLTGSGPVDNPVANGAASPRDPLSKATSAYSATIGSANAPVSFLGLAPDFVGVVQANITVPSGLAPGDYPLTVTINGEASNSATVSVK